MDLRGYIYGVGESELKNLFELIGELGDELPARYEKNSLTDFGLCVDDTVWSAILGEESKAPYDEEEEQLFLVCLGENPGDLIVSFRAVPGNHIRWGYAVLHIEPVRVALVLTTILQLAHKAGVEDAKKALVSKFETLFS